MTQFKKFRMSTGLTVKQFSTLYEIPYRTIQNWEYGLSEPPKYLFKLMVLAWKYNPDIPFYKSAEVFYA